MKKFALPVIVMFSFLSLSINGFAQQTAASQIPLIQVIQFHSEHRCITCLKIEKLTRETLSKSYPDIPFRLYNVEDKKNEKLAEEFEATGTALFLYNPKTGKKKNLTEFAFMKAGNETAFDAELRKHIADFLKG